MEKESFSVEKPKERGSPITGYNKIKNVLQTCEKLWGIKHPESRQLAENLYGEMTK